MIKNRIEQKFRNPNIGEGHISVYKHVGINICTLKYASPNQGDSLKYLIDFIDFQNDEFITIGEATDAIDKYYMGMCEERFFKTYISLPAEDKAALMKQVEALLLYREKGMGD